MPSVKKSLRMPLYPAIRFNTEKSERELAEFSRQALLRASGVSSDGTSLTQYSLSNDQPFYVRRHHILASVAQTEIILRRIFS